jgi:lysyl endopeptidase
MKRNYSIKISTLFILLAICCTAISTTSAQVSTRRLLKPDTTKDVDIGKVKFYSSELTNQAELKSKAQKLMLQGQDPDFGYPVPIDVNVNGGIWTRDIKKSLSIWRVGVCSKGAKAMTINFDKLTISEGTEIFIYNTLKSTIMGPITHTDIYDGAYLTDWIDGDSLIIEVLEPIRNFRTTKLHIKSLLHVLDVNGSAGDILGCHVNAACSIGDPLIAESSGIAIIVDASAGSRICSGTLLNNACQNLNPSLLTAFHCLSGNNANAGNWVVSFGFRNTGCQSTGETERISIPVRDVLVTSEPSDAVIVQLRQRPTINSSVRYLGWSRIQTPAPTSITSLHHPSGHPMKIAIDFNAPVISSANTKTGDTRVNYWRIGIDTGTVQGGSSGASYLDQNGRVVGQHMSSNRTCTFGDRTAWGGRMDISWNNGLQPALSDDPLVTQTNTVGIPSFNLPDIICGQTPVNVDWNGMTNMGATAATHQGVQFGFSYGW